MAPGPLALPLPRRRRPAVALHAQYFFQPNAPP